MQINQVEKANFELLANMKLYTFPYLFLFALIFASNKNMVDNETKSLGKFRFSKMRLSLI